MRPVRILRQRKSFRAKLTHGDERRVEICCGDLINPGVPFGSRRSAGSHLLMKV
jgi:hypothetical protein